MCALKRLNWLVNYTEFSISVELARCTNLRYVLSSTLHIDPWSLLLGFYPKSCLSALWEQLFVISESHIFLRLFSMFGGGPADSMKQVEL